MVRPTLWPRVWGFHFLNSRLSTELLVFVSDNRHFEYQQPDIEVPSKTCLSNLFHGRYFVVQNLAGGDEPQVIRYAALLRGTESAWQAISYGLESLTVFAEHGGVYMNFGLWAVAVAPAWLVVRQFGVEVESSTEAVASAIDTDTSAFKGAMTKEGPPKTQSSVTGSE